MNLAALLVCIAMAQEPPRYEIVVYGDQAVDTARAEAIAAIEAAGWRHVGSRDGREVFRGPSPWTGKAKLTSGGLLTFRGKPVQTRYELIPSITAKRLPPEGVYPFRTISRKDGGQEAAVTVRAPSRAKLSPVRGRLAAAVEPEILAYRRAIQGRALGERLAELPGKLDALWSDGVPLEGEGRLATHEARRGAVLSFWASRTDSPEGDAVCRAVEVWLDEVVQTSPHPITPEELARADAMATHGRRLAP